MRLRQEAEWLRESMVKMLVDPAGRKAITVERVDRVSPFTEYTPRSANSSSSAFERSLHLFHGHRKSGPLPYTARPDVGQHFSKLVSGGRSAWKRRSGVSRGAIGVGMGADGTIHALESSPGSGYTGGGKVLPPFTPQQLDDWSRQFNRFLRLSRLYQADDEEKVDWIIQSAQNVNDRSALERLKRGSDSFEVFLNMIHLCWLSLKSDASVREQ